MQRSARVWSRSKPSGRTVVLELPFRPRVVTSQRVRRPLPSLGGNRPTASRVALSRRRLAVLQVVHVALDRRLELLALLPPLGVFPRVAIVHTEAVEFACDCERGRLQSAMIYEGWLDDKRTLVDCGRRSSGQSAARVVKMPEPTTVYCASQSPPSTRAVQQTSCQPADRAASADAYAGDPPDGTWLRARRACGSKSQARSSEPSVGALESRDALRGGGAAPSPLRRLRGCARLREKIPVPVPGARPEACQWRVAPFVHARRREGFAREAKEELERVDDVQAKHTAQREGTAGRHSGDVSEASYYSSVRRAGTRREEDEQGRRADNLDQRRLARAQSHAVSHGEL